MSQFDANQWASTSVDDNNNDAPDPGVYDVLLSNGRAFTSKAGKDVLILTWRVAAGDQSGYQWDEVYGFGSEGAVKAVKATLTRVGVDVDSLVSLEAMDEAVKAACGEWFQVEVRQNGDFRNTYVNHRVTAPATPPSDINSDPAGFAVPAGVTGTTPTNDVPF